MVCRGFEQAYGSAGLAPYSTSNLLKLAQERVGVAHWYVVSCTTAAEPRNRQAASDEPVVREELA